MSIYRYNSKKKGAVMQKLTFKSNLLPDGHLYCPNEIASKKNAHFKVIVTFEETEAEASESDLELSTIHDTSEDFLTEEELKYYLNLEN